METSVNPHLFISPRLKKKTLELRIEYAKNKSRGLASGPVLILHLVPSQKNRLSFSKEKEALFKIERRTKTRADQIY